MGSQHFHVVRVPVDTLWPGDFWGKLPGDGIVENGCFGTGMVVQPFQDALALVFTIHFRGDQRGCRVLVNGPPFVQEGTGFITPTDGLDIVPEGFHFHTETLATCFMPDAVLLGGSPGLGRIPIEDGASVCGFFSIWCSGKFMES